MKNKMNAFGIGFIVALFWAFNASAFVDLNDAASLSVKYPDGITIANPASGLDLTNLGTAGAVGGDPAGILDVQVNFGFGANQGDERYIRFDLSSGAKFTTDPIYWTEPDGGGAVQESSLSTSGVGGDGNQYYIFNYTSPVQETASTANGKLTNHTHITIFNTDDVTITYNMYKTPSDALNKVNSIASGNKTLVQFVYPLQLTVDPVTTELIDVTTGSKTFVQPLTTASNVNGTNTTLIGDLQVSTTPNLYNTNGSPLVITDIVGVGTTLTVTGEGMFAAVGSPPLAGNVFIDSDGDGTPCNTKSLTSTTVDDSDAVFTTDTDLTNLCDLCVICMVADGTIPIEKGNFDAYYTPTPGAVVSLSKKDFPSPISTLEKNGTSDQITLLLDTSRDAIYDTYIRVSNPTPTQGAVYFTLINDNGDTVTFNMDQVNDMAGSPLPSVLVTQASTELTPIENIFTAAQTADSTFNVSGTSKMLRLDVEAEFGGGGKGVVVNAFALNSDGTGFNFLPK